MNISASAEVYTPPLHEPAQAASQPVKVAVVEREKAAADAVEKKPDFDKELVHVAVAEINHVMQLSAIGVRFEFDHVAEKMVTKVVDAASGELIHQMPSEEMLRISKALDKLQGVLVHHAV